MAWSNATLLFGTLLMAAPIVLHLLLRQRPKRIEFPAIRFVVAGRQSTSRRMRLKHLLLLALRCLVIAVAAIALARPSVAGAVAGRWAAAALLLASSLGLGLLAAATVAESRGGAGRRAPGGADGRATPIERNHWLIRGLLVAAGVTGLGGLAAAGSALGGPAVMIGDQQAPVAAVLVFDTSPRMELRHANQTSLGHAKTLALRLLRELPGDSEAAVLDGRGRGFWSADRGAARADVDRLETTGAAPSLSQVAADAVGLAAESTLARKEVYVFSDLARAAWDEATAGGLRDRLAESPDISLYVLDVGVDQPANLALGDLQLSATTLPRGGRLVVTTQLRGSGAGGVHQVRLDLEDPAGDVPWTADGADDRPSPRPRDRQAAAVAEGQAAGVALSAVLDSPGARHGRVVIEDAGAGDALAIDNERYFTVDVREAWPVLIVTGPDASADFVVDALAPADYEDFACVVAPQQELATRDLSKYAALCLLDPGPLEDALWERLHGYVRRGGALWIQLGRNARSDESFNGPAAQKVLGAPLQQQWRAAERELFVVVEDRSHPAMAYFRDETAAAPWPSLPVSKHWVLRPLPAGARVLAGFSANRHPWTYEWPVGDGRVVVSSTPLSEVRAGPRVWNELALGDNNWPPFIVCNELMLHLVRGADARLNFFTGETVELPNDERTQPRRYQLFLPSEPPQDVTSQGSRLRMPYTYSPGHYRLQGRRGRLVVRGFSCNVPAEASRLERLSPEAFEQLLGEGRCQVADDFQQLQRVQNRQRVGREFFSILMVLLAGVLAIEYLTANRFYRPPAEGGAEPQSRAALAAQAFTAQASEERGRPPAVGQGSREGPA